MTRLVFTKDNLPTPKEFERMLTDAIESCTRLASKIVHRTTKQRMEDGEWR